MTKFIYGIGFNTKEKYKVEEAGKNTVAYGAWHNMIKRCYHPDTQEKNPTYKGCSVDPRWHNYQDFAEWYYEHPYSNKGYQLDKDLLVPKNKIYSPDLCCFVPSQINMLLVDRAALRGLLPQGVDFHKANGRFRAKLKKDGKTCHLGYFDCPDKAHQVYREAKERYVKNKALEWANRIEWNVFVALMNWTLDS